MLRVKVFFDILHVSNLSIRVSQLKLLMFWLMNTNFCLLYYSQLKIEKYQRFQHQRFDNLAWSFWTLMLETLIFLRTHFSFVSTHQPPKIHCAESILPLLYIRWIIRLSSISTVSPSPPIGLCPSSLIQSMHVSLNLWKKIRYWWL